MTSAPWSLAITPPNRELTISRALTRWNFEHYVFKIRRRGCIRGRTRDRLLPAFPGYIFLVANNAWHTLRTIFGIVDFIGHGYTIQAAVVSLMHMADENGVIPTPEISSKRFKLGDTVIIQGTGKIALDGQRAKFQSLVGENQALVELEWFGRPVPQVVDERNLVLEVSEQEKPRRKRRHRRRRRDRNNGAVQHVQAA